MALYVTGDLHGGNEIWKLDAFAQDEGRALTKDDYVIVCGDFGLAEGAPALGLGEDPDSADLHAYWLRWLDEQPWTTLFVDGNHERFDLLGKLPEEAWRGGRVRRLAPSVLHLMRGCVFDVGGAAVFAMGGASSHDRDARTEGVDWWPEELPGFDEMDQAEAALDRAGWKVDYVVTHAQPQRVAAEAMLPRHPHTQDRLTSWLAWVDERLAYKHWYSGHLHVDKRVGERHTVVFSQVIRLNAHGKDKS